MNNLSDRKQALIEAYDKGYRVIGNEVIYKGNVRKLDIRQKKNDGGGDYASFGVRNGQGKRVNVFVHQLIAYQKFKEKFLTAEENNLVVVHLDGNTLNNDDKNIILGTRDLVRKIRLNNENYSGSF